MTYKKLRGLLMKTVMIISYYILKKLTCISLCYKEKIFAHQVNIKNIFWVHMQTTKIWSKSDKQTCKLTEKKLQSFYKQYHILRIEI